MDAADVGQGGLGLAGILEYLEDPTPGLDGMAEVAQQAPMPLATNMCVVAFDQLGARGGETVRCGVVLSDHHYWGGLQRSRLLAGICDTFGLGLSMHSNSHLGISLAAMVHLAGADAEPHVRVRHALAVEDRGDRQAGRPRRSSTAPVRRCRRRRGWASRSTRTRSVALHEQYLRCGIRDRDDTGYMQSIDPAFSRPSARAGDATEA